MTGKLKATPGPWYALTGDNGGIIDQATVCSEHEMDGEPTFIADTMTVDDEVPLEQRKANAALIAEAGTVFHEIGLTPRQLADHRADLLGLARLILSGITRRKIKDQSLLRQVGEEIEIEALSTKLKTAIARAEQKGAST
jgi:hypothetical protein